MADIDHALVKTARITEQVPECITGAFLGNDVVSELELKAIVAHILGIHPFESEVLVVLLAFEGAIDVVLDLQVVQDQVVIISLPIRHVV